jgi:hypothetical protein
MTFMAGVSTVNPPSGNYHHLWPITGMIYLDRALVNDDYSKANRQINRLCCPSPTIMEKSAVTGK